MASGASLLIHHAKRVPPAEFIEQQVEPGALLGQEARVLLVAAPVLDIDVLVGDVDVAADDPLAPVRQHLPQQWRQARHDVELHLLARLAT